MDFQMFASLPAADLERARSCYEEKLGVKPTETIDGDQTLMYVQGDGGFIIYPSQFAGTNQATAAGLAVADFDAAIAELRSRNVVFEDYDLGENFQTVDGIVSGPDGMRSAWFKDSEGNILGITQDPRT